jgi:hypothetical protein
MDGHHGFVYMKLALEPGLALSFDVLESSWSVLIPRNSRNVIVGESGQ